MPDMNIVLNLPPLLKGHGLMYPSFDNVHQKRYPSEMLIFPNQLLLFYDDDHQTNWSVSSLPSCSVSLSFVVYRESLDPTYIGTWRSALASLVTMSNLGQSRSKDLEVEPI